MSRVCDVCDKGFLTVTNISHKQSGGWAKRAPKTKRKSYPNLRTMKVSLDNSTNLGKIKICMRCYRTIKSKSLSLK
jgi:large subunit ribosomal protein L28